MQPLLCLGSAQFGTNYGITNVNGQLDDVEVSAILGCAAQCGFSYVDTAQSYGNAETMLGRNWPKSHSFRIIDKLPSQSAKCFTLRDLELWEQAFSASCYRLGVKTIDDFLLHSPSDLSKPGGHFLEEWLLSLRERQLVKRLGVSIYNAVDLVDINNDLLDVVQLPLSLFDQRLLQDGTISRLYSAGVAIHGRSLYLQGLLLTPSAKWPDWIRPEFRLHQKKLEELANDKGCRLIDLALGFAREQFALEAVVLGVCSVSELMQLQLAWTGPVFWKMSEWKSWSLSCPSILDPRVWPC